MCVGTDAHAPHRLAQTTHMLTYKCIQTVNYAPYRTQIYTSHGNL